MIISRRQRDYASSSEREAATISADMQKAMARRRRTTAMPLSLLLASRYFVSSALFCARALYTSKDDAVLRRAPVSTCHAGQSHDKDILPAPHFTRVDIIAKTGYAATASRLPMDEHQVGDERAGWRFSAAASCRRAARDIWRVFLPGRTPSMRATPHRNYFPHYAPARHHHARLIVDAPPRHRRRPDIDHFARCRYHGAARCGNRPHERRNYATKHG